MESQENKEHKERVLKACRNMIGIDPSGTLHYFWLEKGSCLSSDDLRAIADEIDRLNEDWHVKCEEYFKSK